MHVCMTKKTPQGIYAFPTIANLQKRKLNSRSLKRLTRARWLTIIATLVLIGTVVGTVGAIAAIAYVSRDLPSPTNLTNREVAQSTKIYDRNAVLLYDIYDGEHDRSLVQLKDLPKSIVDATVSAEDAGFYEHQGFDVKGIAYAFFKDLTSHSIEGGGSTITQQLVKLAILQDTHQTVTRKIKELILSVQ